MSFIQIPSIVYAQQCITGYFACFQGGCCLQGETCCGNICCDSNSTCNSVTSCISKASNNTQTGTNTYWYVWGPIILFTLFFVIALYQKRTRERENEAAIKAIKDKGLKIAVSIT